MENRVDHTNEQVPYMLGNHDVIALLGKVNNLERNVITLVIGENENYKDISNHFCFNGNSINWAYFIQQR